MLRHLGLIAVSTCIVASVGCGEGATGPGPLPTVTVEFSGRVVNADTEDPAENVRISVDGSAVYGRTDSATSGGDGTFTLRLTLPPSWVEVKLKLTGPGYDERFWRFEPNTAGTRAEIRMYPTLVIRPGESIDVRLEPTISLCPLAGTLTWSLSCRPVLVEASPGEPVELEIVTHDSSKPLGLADDVWVDEEVDLRLMVAPGGLAYVVWPLGAPERVAEAAREGRLTARRRADLLRAAYGLRE